MAFAAGPIKRWKDTFETERTILWSRLHMLLDIEGFGAGCICYDRLVMHGFQFHKLEEYEAARIMSVHGALLFHSMTGYVDGDDIAQRRAYVGVLKELWPLSLPPIDAAGCGKPHFSRTSYLVRMHAEGVFQSSEEVSDVDMDEAGEKEAGSGHADAGARSRSVLMRSLCQMSGRCLPEVLVQVESVV